MDYPASVYASLRKSVHRHIREQLHLEQGESDYYDYVVDFALIHAGVDVSSLNYDLALELACLRHDVAFTDGSIPDGTRSGGQGRPL